MKIRKNIKGFSMVEVLIVLTVISICFAGIVNASLQISRHIEKTKKQTTSRKELSTFCQSIYSFGNKSYGAFFYDTVNDANLDYLATYEALNQDGVDRTIYDMLFLMKDSTGASNGYFVYSPSGHKISWYTGSGAQEQVMLTDVYRVDYESDSDPGTMPVFKFPHRQNLYDGTNPRFFVIEFKKMIQVSGVINEKITIPVKMMVQLNTINN